MQWLCPEHGEPWRVFDRAERDYSQRRSELYQEAAIAFEKQWLEAYEESHPQPIPPPFQTSLNDNDGNLL